MPCYGDIMGTWGLIGFSGIYSDGIYKQQHDSYECHKPNTCRSFKTEIAGFKDAYIVLPKKHHCECGHVITWEVVGRPGVVIVF